MSGVANKLISAAGSGAEPEGAWDLSLAYYDPPEGLAWSISTAFYRGFSRAIATQETAPSGVFLSSDGTKMYVVGTSSDAVNEYGLSVAWNVSSASYVRNRNVSSEDTAPADIFFKPDGTKMYVLGGGTDSVYEYDLSTAWNVSTASYLQGLSVNAQDSSPEGLYFKPDGTKMYVVGRSTDSVLEYNLGTAWDVSTASYLQNFSIAAENNDPTSVFFKADGTKMYVTGFIIDRVDEYALSTAWDVSTASYTGDFLSVVAQEDQPRGMFFKQDGTALYVVGTTSDRVYQYTLGGFDFEAQEGTAGGLFFKLDGTKMYITGAAGDDVNEYDLSTAWDLSTASFLRLFSVAAQDTSPTDIFFKPDGTKMYITGGQGRDVNEYDLSTAWNVSSASFIQNFSVATQDIAPEALFFKPNGLTLYVYGNDTDSVYEYSLSTAWDISTASFTQSLVISESVPSGLSFKPDGTKMFTTGKTSDRVNERTLSTAWDISVGTGTAVFSTDIQLDNNAGLFFKPDGTQMFVIGTAPSKVYAYTIAPQE